MLKILMHFFLHEYTIIQQSKSKPVKQVQMQNFGFDKVNQPTKTCNTEGYRSYCVIVCLVLSATKYRDSTSWGYTGYLKFADRSDDLTSSVHLKYKSIWSMYKCTRGWQHVQALSCVIAIQQT